LVTERVNVRTIACHSGACFSESPEPTTGCDASGIGRKQTICFRATTRKTDVTWAGGLAPTEQSDLKTALTTIGAVYHI
jgi:hypothetical protein